MKKAVKQTNTQTLTKIFTGDVFKKVQQEQLPSSQTCLPLPFTFPNTRANYSQLIVSVFSCSSSSCYFYSLCYA